MKRSSLIVCAIAFAAIVASPAQASFKVVKWVHGGCQVWDNSIPTSYAPDGRVVSRNYRTFARAAARHSRLVARKVCAW